MRKLGQGSKTITATPRQLESLIRLSESLAKMRLSNVVERRDVAEAVRFGHFNAIFFCLVLFLFLNLASFLFVG